MVSHSLSNSNEQTLSPDEAARRAAVRRWRSEVYESLLLADMDEEAMLWESCCSTAKVEYENTPGELHENVSGYWVCPDRRDHGAVVTWNTCDLRYCPTCARRHAARLVHQYAPVAERLLKQNLAGYRLRKIVLTTSIAVDDPQAKAAYESGFDAVRKTLDMALNYDWKLSEGETGDWVQQNPAKPRFWHKKGGAIAVSEFGETGHKLHYHLLAYVPFINQRLLSHLWSLNSPNGESVVYVSDATRFYDDPKTAVRETLKYAAKFFKKDQHGNWRGIEPRLIPILADILKGSRRVRSWGAFYGCEKPEREPQKCKHCQAELIRIPLKAWHVYANEGSYLTPREFKEVWLRASLNSIPANKSSSENSKPPPEPPDKPVQRALFDDLGDLEGHSSSENALSL